MRNVLHVFTLGKNLENKATVVREIWREMMREEAGLRERSESRVLEGF